MRAPEEQGWTGRLAVMSVAAAVAVSVIYLPQPMLVDLARSLGASTAGAGIIATAVQIGYACGIFLLVPVSERVQPRRQITAQSFAIAAALLLTAVLPSVAAVATGFLAVGLVANIPQLIIPAAGKLAPAGKSGSTTAALAGALLCGIFGGRVVSGLLVEVIGWRWVLVVFAALVLAVLPAVRAVLGEVELSAPGASYGRLLVSTLRLLRGRNGALLPSSAMQFFGFATFNSLWTVAALYLITGPTRWSASQAGLFGLVGLAAGILTPFAGRVVDRIGSLRAVGAFGSLLVLASLATAADSSVIWLFGVTAFLLTWSSQSMQAANQNRVLTTNPGAAGQANTLFMVAVFLGGSFGSFVGPLAYETGGMPAVGGQAAVLSAVALVIWAVTARRARSAAAAAVTEPAITR